MKPLRDLLKHSSVYMIGQILSRMASVLLLPFYTHMLSPSDYGVVSILDLTLAIPAMILAGGMASAITRHHFDDSDAAHQDKVWWTGLSMVSAVCTVICIVMLIGRQTLADVTLGPEIAHGAWFYTLTIATLWFTVIGVILDSYLRVMKWSGIFVVVSMGRLLYNIGINVWLLLGLNMGVEGLVIGNLSATVLQTLALLVIFLKTRGRFAIERQIGGEMLKFAAPLVLAALGGTIMHEGDRYFLRLWVNMDEVGIYSLAHKIGFAVHSLCLLPFLSIWHVAIYDIERLPDARQVFGKMFLWFTAGLGILLLGASLTVHPVLPWLTPDAYGPGIEMVSVILLGFFLFALSFMFEVPALLTKRTRLMVPAAVAGPLVNIAANCALIPFLGAWGAAWAGVITYLIYSAVVLWKCRRAQKIPYPWFRSVATAVALCLTYLVVRFAAFPAMGPLMQLCVSVVVCAGWAAALFGKEGLDVALELIHERRLKRLAAVPELEDHASAEQQHECPLVASQ
ncbi:MAG: lipopolysaccharide biosynthesis protein [Planctomycetaceae bacterium]